MLEVRAGAGAALGALKTNEFAELVLLATLGLLNKSFVLLNPLLVTLLAILLGAGEVKLSEGKLLLVTEEVADKEGAEFSDTGLI